MKLWFERLYPHVAAAVTGGGSFWVIRHYDAADLVEKSIKPVLSSTVDIGAIAVGFLGAALGLVLAVQQGPAGQWIEKTGLRGMMIKYLWGALGYSAALALLSLLSLVLDGLITSPEHRKSLYLVLAPLWTAGLVGTVASCNRALAIFGRILTWQQ